MASAMAANIECPICFDVPSPPIYQCSNGHIFCSNCLSRIRICGICREPLPERPIRSLMAEELAKTVAKLKISKSRERLTNYCHLLGLTDILNCKVSIRRDQIAAHMKEHQLNGINGSKAYVIQELEDFTNPQNWLPVYFEAHDEIFFLLSSTQWDCNHDSSLTVSWWCVMVGDPSEAKNFNLQLCLTNNDKGLNNIYNCPISSIENYPYSADSKYSLSLSQLKNLGKYNRTSETNKLEWDIGVQIEKQSENTNRFQNLENMVFPNVKTCTYTVKKQSCITSLNRNIVPSSWGNTKVFLDLAYDQKLIGRLVIELRNDMVPRTAENFRCLCTGEKGYGYKGTCFFNFVLRKYMTGGDITKNDGFGGKSIYGRNFNDENFFLKHNERGILSMAKRKMVNTNGSHSENSSINTNGSVFHITLKEQADWDGQRVVFGKVVEGMKVLDDLELLVLDHIPRSFFNFCPFKTTDGKTVIQNCGQL